MIFEIAHHMALIPVVWLGWLRFRGRDLGLAWWLLAGAFSISWLADWAAHWFNPLLVSPVYLVSQAWIVSAVFLSRREMLLLVTVLTLTGLAAVLWRGVSEPDVLLHTVAWLSVVGIVYQLPQLARLRTALLVAFGLGWLAWLGYAISPGWISWLIYQSVRATGIGLFCWAATSPLPVLKLSRA
jgi:hypothetical protein